MEFSSQIAAWNQLSNFYLEPPVSVNVKNIKCFFYGNKNTNIQRQAGFSHDPLLRKHNYEYQAHPLPV